MPFFRDSYFFSFFFFSKCRLRSSGRWRCRKTRRLTVAEHTSGTAGYSLQPTVSSTTKTQPRSMMKSVRLWVDFPCCDSRPSPTLYKIKFSLWKKFQAQATTDIVPVEDVIIHPRSGAEVQHSQPVIGC